MPTRKSLPVPTHAASKSLAPPCYRSTGRTITLRRKRKSAQPATRGYAIPSASMASLTSMPRCVIPSIRARRWVDTTAETICIRTRMATVTWDEIVEKELIQRPRATLPHRPPAPQPPVATFQKQAHIQGVHDQKRLTPRRRQRVVLEVNQWLHLSSIGNPRSRPRATTAFSYPPPHSPFICR